LVIPNKEFFFYQDCSGVGRLGFSDSISLGVDAQILPIFPETRADEKCRVSKFFIGSRFQSEVVFSTLNSLALRKSFLVSISPNLIYSPGQILKAQRFKFLPASIFPIFPFDLFLGNFFLLALFRSLVRVSWLP
jgi:hypothetical protein